MATRSSLLQSQLSDPRGKQVSPSFGLDEPMELGLARELGIPAGSGGKAQGHCPLQCLRAEYLNQQPPRTKGVR